MCVCVCVFASLTVCASGQCFNERRDESSATRLTNALPSSWGHKKLISKLLLLKNDSSQPTTKKIINNLVQHCIILLYLCVNNIYRE